MTSRGETVEEVQDQDGVVNPGFIVEEQQRTIQTRTLEPGITTSNRAYSQNSLPDILNAHLPPPYEAVVVVDPASSRHRSGRRRRHDTDTEKSCCLSCCTSVTRFKWLLWTLAILGIGCVVAGAALGVLHQSSSSFIPLSITFIGLGLVMIFVVLFGWRCTPRGHEPCHLLLNLGEFARPGRRRHDSAGSTGSRSGRRREYGRRSYWSGGVIYGDHQYRQPPPSYAAAMQDFERQLLARMSNLEPVPSSPPPTYKSQASMQRPGMRNIFPEQPPTYTSRPGTLRPNRTNNLDNDAQRQHEHSLNIANITVHHDNVSTRSIEDNLSYYGTAEEPMESRNNSNNNNHPVERVMVHTSGRQYGTAERSAVRQLEQSIEGGDGIVNTSMVLEEERVDERTNAATASNHSNKNDVNLNTASLLRAADQNLQRLLQRNESNASRHGQSSEPRFGSARVTSHRRDVINQISHMRSSSASGVDFHYQEHIATLV